MGLRIFGRWLLYTLCSGLILLMLVGGAGHWHSDKPKGSTRSLVLCFVGALLILGGIAAWLALPADPPYGVAGATLSWTGAVVATVAAWMTISTDLHREDKA